MIPFQIKQGVFDNLPKILEEGTIYYCIDKDIFCLDIKDENGILSRKILKGVGEDVSGDYFMIEEVETLAEVGAEIFNDYENNIATGSYSHAEGSHTKALGDNSHAEGQNTEALDVGAHAEGYSTKAKGYASHTEGYGTQATGYVTHAEGYMTQATQNAAHAEGDGTKATGQAAHAEGYESEAIGRGSHAEGRWTIALGDGAHAEGYEDHYTLYTSSEVVSGETVIPVEDLQSVEYFEYVYINETKYTIKEIDITNLTITLTSGVSSILPVGTSIYYSGAMGDYSHTEGNSSTATGESAHAEGFKTQANGDNSHAEGEITEAVGEASHAEGRSTQAIGEASHAEGLWTDATGYASHAEGYESEASGFVTHAEGYYTQAIGQYSHAEGEETIASGESQHVQGKYNIEDTENRFAHIVGNGEYQAPSNMHTLDWQGNAWFAGTLKIGGATQDDEAAAEVLTSLDLPNENDALELLYEMGIIELIIDENGLILTDENGNILTGK